MKKLLFSTFCTVITMVISAHTTNDFQSDSNMTGNEKSSITKTSSTGINTEGTSGFTTSHIPPYHHGLNHSSDSVFVGKFYNEEFKLELYVNLYKHNILIPGQEIFGEVDGYVKSKQSSNIWIITSSELSKGMATLEMINDYGSEEFIATLSIEDDNTIIFQHKKGSTFKFAVNRKWQKIPSKITFIKK